MCHLVTRYDENATLQESLKLPLAFGRHKFSNESSVFFVGANESSIFFIVLVWPTEANVSKNKKMPLLRVGLLRIGTGSTPPPSSEGGGRWPAAAATRPGSSHHQSDLDLVDLLLMPRTRSIFHCSGLHLHHRLHRWGEGWRRPATVATEPPLLTARSSHHRSPPKAAIVAQHHTQAWIRVADAVGGGREEACSSYRRSESSRHSLSLDPHPRHHRSGEIRAARPRYAAA
jgi:hypothetical protein